MFATCCAVDALVAQDAGTKAEPLGQAATEAVCARYAAADHWVQKAVLLLSLNSWWHPSGAGMVAQALRDMDPRLVAFGVEALLRADAELLPAIASADLLEELIGKQLARSNAHLRERVLAALHRLVPTVQASDRNGWVAWWSTAKATWAPRPWTPRDNPGDRQGGTSAVAQRAFDLYQAGLDMMICIDSTGSMQPTIDALGHALGEMVDILDGISPKMRLGIVHYKDYGELGKPGAKVVQPFTKNVQAARKSLGDLRALGGGDLPEAVLGGLDLALDAKMNWKKDANKIVVLIGDAPPHAEDKDKVIALVRAAHDTPGVPLGKPTTGPRPDDTPFLTSCIGVFLNLQGKLRNQRGYAEFVESQQRMREDFTAIAAAGGGVFVEVEFTFTDEATRGGKDDKGKDKPTSRDAGTTVASAATKRIVEHILVLSFGDRFGREMRDFVRIFYEYKEGGLIK